jgi:hypothetical protein
LFQVAKYWQLLGWTVERPVSRGQAEANPSSEINDFAADGHVVASI